MCDVEAASGTTPECSGVPAGLQARLSVQRTSHRLEAEGFRYGRTQSLAASRHGATHPPRTRRACPAVRRRRLLPPTARLPAGRSRADAGSASASVSTPVAQGGEGVPGGRVAERGGDGVRREDGHEDADAGLAGGDPGPQRRSGSAGSSAIIEDVVFWKPRRCMQTLTAPLPVARTASGATGAVVAQVRGEGGGLSRVRAGRRGSRRGGRRRGRWGRAGAASRPSRRRAARRRRSASSRGRNVRRLEMAAAP